MKESGNSLKNERKLDLAGRVIGAAMKVHRVLGPGFLEEVYRRSLAVELGREKIEFKEEHALPVYYDGLVVGNYRADIMVQGELVVEIKAVQVLIIAHEVQLVNYLTAAQLDSGLLLNFGAGKLEFKRKYRRQPRS
jgi:GxxExxY protein